MSEYCTYLLGSRHFKVIDIYLEPGAIGEDLLGEVDNQLKNHLKQLFKNHLTVMGYRQQHMNCCHRTGINDDLCIIENTDNGVSKKYMIHYMPDFLHNPNQCTITITRIERALEDSSHCN